MELMHEPTRVRDHGRRVGGAMSGHDCGVRGEPRLQLGTRVRCHVRSVPTYLVQCAAIQRHGQGCREFPVGPYITNVALKRTIHEKLGAVHHVWRYQRG